MPTRDNAPGNFMQRSMMGVGLALAMFVGLYLYGSPQHRALNNGRINTIIAKHLPTIGEATARTFGLGDAAHLRQLLEAAGFQNVEICRQAHRFELPSFDAYFGPFERGGASTGQAYLTLDQTTRDAVRKEVQLSFGDTGGPVGIEVEFQFASGKRS